MKTIMARIVLVACAAGLLSACAESSLYSWNGYSHELLAYYKSPGETQKFAEKLREDIEKAEEKDQVPPGLYAEYGYAMLELGEADTAVRYFSKERDKWPESAYLMNTVMGRLATVAPVTETPVDDPTGQAEGAGQ